MDSIFSLTGEGRRKTSALVFFAMSIALPLAALTAKDKPASVSGAIEGELEGGLPWILKQTLSVEVMGIALYQYFTAFLLILLGFMLRRVSRNATEWALKKSREREFRFGEAFVTAFGPPITWAFIIGAVYLATLALPMPTQPINFHKLASVLLKSSSAILVIWVGTRLIDQFTALWMEKAQKTETKLDEQFIPIVRSSSRVFFFLIGIVLVLQNLGYSVTSLVAGLGIGGAAVAFASKDTLSNLFGSAVIFMDRPFQIGDWIEVGDVEGTVEEVGLRTTKIRTFANSLITLPNSQLTVTPINNWSKMKKRRIKTTIGLSYDASPDQVSEAVEAIRKLIREAPKLHSDFFLVNFENFGDSSLDIFIYCFTKTTNWAEYMDARQEFYLGIMREFEKIGVEFAFPTTTVHVESLPGEPEAMKRERPV